MEKDFLQSEEWRKFQEAVGRKTFLVSDSFPPRLAGHPLPQAGEEDILFYASIIEHKLPIVGKYFYIPHGPEISALVETNPKSQNPNSKQTPNPKVQIQNGMQNIINLAKENKAGWIRIEPANNDILGIIRNTIDIHRNQSRIVKSPHDMQPREIFVIDIAKSEEQLLAEMKSKTRYNIRLAEKKGLKVSNFQCQITNQFPMSNNKNFEKYINEFLRLNKIMAARQGIKTHPDEYYRKMFEVIPENIIKLYVAEYKSEIIAANIMVFYNKISIYLHGASDDKYKNLMAPYLLHWQVIKDAKKMGCEKYDMGGVCCSGPTASNWQGITRFKLGFSPSTKSVKFPGSYDIIINPLIYWLYRVIQKTKNLI